MYLCCFCMKWFLKYLGLLILRQSLSLCQSHTHLRYIFSLNDLHSYFRFIYLLSYLQKHLYYIDTPIIFYRKYSNIIIKPCSKSSAGWKNNLPQFYLEAWRCMKRERSVGKHRLSTVLLLPTGLAYPVLYGSCYFERCCLARSVCNGPKALTTTKKKKFNLSANCLKRKYFLSVQHYYVL